MTAVPSSSEPRHPSRVVSERTGLSPDVLRSWERRHRAVVPGRSDAGQRLYSDDDVERLSMLVKVTEAGRSVSMAASMSLASLRSLVAEDAERSSSGATPAAEFRERAWAAVEELAPDRLQIVLRTALLSLGATTFLDDVVPPLLQRMGESWHAGDIGIAQEHAASAVIRSELAWLVTALDVPEGAPRAVVACLTRERHELGAALATAAAVHAGWRVAYLGSELPAVDIARAASRHDAAVVGVSVVVPEDAATTRSELHDLRQQLRPHAALLVGGGGAASLEPLGDGITVVRDLAHWRALLRAKAPVGGGRQA